MIDDQTGVLIVGASLAGSETAQGLRSRGFDGAITLVGAEAQLPYDRPPLSKSFLTGTTGCEDLLLRPAASYDTLGVDLRLGERAVDVDPLKQYVSFRGGGRIRYDTLVIATGARARPLRAAAALDGVHVLRTVDDAVAIGRALRLASRVVIVGGGFIGAEVAASAHCLGVPVTILEALAVPLARGVGPEMGAVLGRLHTERGVDLRCGVEVTGFIGDTKVEGVQLSTGVVVDADLVVVGVGAIPETGWLSRSTLDVRDGVLCDAHLRSVTAKNIFAVGDVARWPSARYGVDLRLEHWTSAKAQAMHVADHLTGGVRRFDVVPYVWSDQYEHIIQIAGRCSAGDRVEIVNGSVDEFQFVALYTRGPHLVGAMGLDSKRALLKVRQVLVRNGSPEDARVAASTGSRAG